MSLRQQARILGIAPSYLNMMVNGKRPWKPEIKDRYDQLVNSLPKSVHKNPVGGGGEMRHLGAKDIIVGGIRVELMTSAMYSKKSWIHT
jgi:hypothetical protein